MINDFKGKYAFLSNFFPVPVNYSGTIYPSVENAYQAAKTNSVATRKGFVLCSARDAKRLGKKVSLRPDWEEVKTAVMLYLLNEKFSRDPILNELLLNTHPEDLIEGNYYHNNFWGVCYCPKCRGRGENNLGRLLVKLRNDIMREYQSYFRRAVVGLSPEEQVHYEGRRRDDVS